ncbi:MAG: RNA 2',3'-cyclic phosphodiesterase [Candidatus Aenigmarchaeota archaeon]|nr:RNA 2',3'-cyclic phosphodiesterase [Candidatus Aenigmarchaeota archaeon]NIQ18115.1 RNA 2',3'-cyclic phosphodiesterase [Candidatus Aenigmarchaeota archaeon]NIT04144.1 RNA 2',3'-cyclic phosphodiesterase [Candidatus Saccharibacteria bacterium]
MRVFISIPLPKSIREELVKVQKDFAELPTKWVEEENLHITLVFIGKTEKEKVKAATGVLGGITSDPINLKTDGFSLLPHERTARILAIKLTGETEKISTLTEKIKGGLRERRINFDEKPFRPHITLARLKDLNSDKRRKLKEKVQTVRLPKMGFKADTIQLTESKLTPTGPIYKTISAVTLR